jgi:glyoxylase-like metal-dependent hydrolase (beta-lactamase superfamily II)
MSRWTFGAITVDRVVELEQPLLPPATLYPTSTPARWDAHRAWLEPSLLDPATGLLVMAIAGYVVRTPRRTIVVDTCAGNDKPRPQKPRYHLKTHPWLDRLTAIGVEPERVDLVVSTHLHVDHVGWNTRRVGDRWVPTFPRARYLIPRVEWEFWREEYKRPAFTDDPYYEDSLLPVIDAGLVDWIGTDHALDDGVRLVPLAGHTPGHVGVEVRGGGRVGVMSGDLVHHPVQCAEPEWNSCFCVDAEGARATRRAFLERLAGTDTLVLTAHFRAPGAGRIVRAGAAFAFRFDEGPR